MELRHLRYFVAVAEALNFRRASERLRVAQPALSKQIQDLEYELGVRLLDRDTGGVRLTDAGSAFLSESRLILAHSQQAVIAAREAANGRRGRISVGYLASLLMGFMPGVLKAFGKRYPGVEVVLVEMPIMEQMAALESGAIQVGFAIGGHIRIPAGLLHAQVARSRVGAVMGRGHRLARLPRVALADLVREPLLCLSFRKGVVLHADITRQILSAHGLKPGPITGIESTETFRATLASGMGVTLIAEIASLSQSRDLVFKRLSDTGDDLVLELLAMWRKGEPSQLVTNFVELMKTLKAPGKLGSRA